MKKTIKKILILLIVLPLIALNFIYADIDNNCYIVLVPFFMPSNFNTKEALKIIKNTSPEDYSLICENVKFINKNPGCGGFEGGCFYGVKPNAIYLGNDQVNIATAAAIIIHETCHVMQYKEGRTMSEEECHTIDSEYSQKITKYPIDKDGKPIWISEQ